MATRTARKARSRANASRKGEANASKTETAPLKVVKLHRKSGLEWLASKRKITPKQLYTGLQYGRDFRLALVDGQEPLRSCLDDSPRGGAGTGSLSRAEFDATVTERLEGARAALRNHTDMVLACDAICGRQLTPREINPVQREAERLEHTLRIALDLMEPHYRLTNYLKRA